MTAAAERRVESWGVGACRLAPRATGGGLPDLALDGLVRVSFAVEGTGRRVAEILSEASLSVRRGPTGRLTLLVRRAALEALDGARTEVRLLLDAFDAACAPAPPPRLVGVVNVTPDSFSDGGLWLDPVRAVEHGRALRAAGAALLDVGGESTRPGATPVEAEEERARVVPVVAALVAEGLGPVSIDTRRSLVAEAALEAGASVVNDVEAGLHDPRMLPLVAERGAGYVAMHMLGRPATMQTDPTYGDVVDEVAEFLRLRLAACVAAGIEPDRVWLDPGIGFGKTVEHNLTLLSRLGELRSLGRPLFVGVSRKRFIGALTGESVAARRLHGTSGAIAACVQAGVESLRVHDVGEMRAVASVATAIREASAPRREARTAGGR